jgi:hypothetical protein
LFAATPLQRRRGDAHPLRAAARASAATALAAVLLAAGASGSAHAQVPGGPPPGPPPAPAPAPIPATPIAIDPCTIRPAIQIEQPVDAGMLKVARVAGAEAGQADQWEIEYDAWFCNLTGSTYTVTAVKIEHLNANSVIRTLNPAPAGTTSIGAGKPAPGYVMVRDKGQFDFPLPTSARITFTLAKDGGGGTIDVVSEHPLAEHVNPGRVGGYFAPFRQSDLPSGRVWTQGRHAESNFQRFAYDMGVQRWTGTKWTDRKAGYALDSKEKEAFGSFGVKMYAVADGEIIGCNRGADDHDKGAATGNVPGGNLIWLRTGDETVLYAHLQKNTIPFDLCPFSDDKEHKLADPSGEGPDDAKYRVKVGQFLGRSGGSGSSLSAPHLHIHAFRGLPKIWGGSETGIDADSRPMRFVNVRVQPKAAGNVVASKWRDLDRAATFPYETRIQGDPCAHAGPAAGALETVRLQVKAACFGELYNTMVYRNQRPVHIDVTERGTTTFWSSVWRPEDGTPWLLYMGLTRAGVDQQVAAWDDEGFRILEAESYNPAGSGIRYALLMVKQPGPAQKLTGPQNAAAFQSTFNAQKAAGMRPVNISVSRQGGQRAYTALYEQAAVGSFYAKGHLPVADYKSTFDAQKQAGRSLSFVEGHVLSNVAAIWYSALTGAYRASGVMGRAAMEAEIAKNHASGRYTRSLSGWYSNGKFRYVGLWWSRPDTKILTGPQGTSTSNSAAFAFRSTDPLARLECKLDAAAYAPCVAGQTYLALTSGAHQFSVRARSRDGIADSTPASRGWTVQ